MDKTPKQKQGISRRKFLKNAGGVTLFIGASGLLSQVVACRDKKKVKAILKKQQLTAWIEMDTEGNMTIFNPAAEMGQGSMTSLPVIFTEEMDADWSKVKVKFSPQIAEIYGSEGWGPNRKIMLSAGSRVTQGYYNMLRKAGAQTRYLFLLAAAEKWQLPIEELSTIPGMVIHLGSAKKITYAALVGDLVMPETLPDISESQLKDPKDFRLIGTVIPRTDIPEKVDGSAKFAGDMQLPGMVYGVIERGRIHGAHPELQNEKEVLEMPGVVKVVFLDHGIGIIAQNIEQALTAKAQLQINWSNPKASGFDSQEIYASYRNIAAKGSVGNVVVEKGHVKSAFKKAAKTYESDYLNDYVYHAQMEPLNSIVQISEDGNSAEVWVGTQQGFDSKLGVPDLLNLPPENVKINMCYLGGGFGRRSMTDFVLECTLLAKEMIPKPVKLLWTRQDDLTYGAYRPLSLQRLKAAIDANGKLTGFSHVIVGNGDNLLASGIKNEYYDIDNQWAELRIQPNETRLKHWRAVGHGPNKFAIESMIDEIAKDQNTDPVAFRRQLMQKSPRALATLEKAALIANWGAPLQEGRAKGVAFLERSGTLSTGICEISLNHESGKIKVHHFWSASDAGVIVQPDNVKAQMEGGIIMGISSTLLERISIVDGVVQESNFNDYRLLRMEDMPESIETALIDSSNPPKGVGESGTPLVACAIANAFLALTGKSIRHLPFTPEKVLGVLRS